MKRRSFIASLLAACGASAVVRALPAQAGAPTAVAPVAVKAPAVVEDPDAIILSGRMEIELPPITHTWLDVTSLESTSEFCESIAPSDPNELKFTLHELAGADRDRLIDAQYALKVRKFILRPKGSIFEFRFDGYVMGCETRHLFNDSSGASLSPFVVNIKTSGQPTFEYAA